MYNNTHLNKRYLGKVSIGIVDDHVLLRDFMATAINELGDFEVILRATNGQDMIDQLKHTALPEIMILDLNMPVMNGYDTIKWLMDNHPQVNVLVVTMFDSEAVLIRLLRAGVRAFLRKDAPPRELEQALKALMQDRYFYPPEISRRINGLFQRPGKELKSLSFALNEQELHFLELCCSDITYREMAREIFVSPRTIDNYRDNLFQKLNVRSRIGLVLYAVKNGIIPF
jgi:two-component system invasion response regulator UvrY